MQCYNQVKNSITFTQYAVESGGTKKKSQHLIIVIKITPMKKQ